MAPATGFAAGSAIDPGWRSLRRPGHERAGDRARDEHTPTFLACHGRTSITWLAHRRPGAAGSNSPVTSSFQSLVGTRTETRQNVPQANPDDA